MRGGDLTTAVLPKTTSGGMRLNAGRTGTVQTSSVYQTDEMFCVREALEDETGEEVSYLPR